MFKVKTTNNNNSILLVLGVAAIMMVGGLAGALAIVMSNDSNTNAVQYAPETDYELKEYAMKISRTNDLNETVLYDSLMNKSFSVDGKIGKINSAESFRTYLTSLGFLVETDTMVNQYALRTYTMTYDDVNVLKTKFYALSMSDEYVNPYLIETITADVFANSDFAMLMPEINNIDDLVALLSDTNSDTLLSKFFGGRAYYGTMVTLGLFENSVNAQYVAAAAAKTPMANVITSSDELMSFLYGVDSDFYWDDLMIFFASPDNDMVMTEDLQLEDMKSAAATTTTVGELLGYISFYSADVAVAA